MNPNQNPCGAACPKYKPGTDCDCSRRRTYMLAKERMRQESQKNSSFANFRRDAIRYSENRRKRGE